MAISELAVNPDRRIGLYKICVCWFRDRAVVNTIPGIRHLLYCTSPPLYFAINIAQYLVSPRPPCFAIQHTILVMAISCKGQPTHRFLSNYVCTYIHLYLAVYLYLSIYPSTYLSLSLSLSIYIYIYVYLSIAITIYRERETERKRYIHTHTHIYIAAAGDQRARQPCDRRTGIPSIYISFHTYIHLHLSICLFVYVSIYPSIYPYIYLSIHLHIYIYIDIYTYICMYIRRVLCKAMRHIQPNCACLLTYFYLCRSQSRHVSSSPTSLAMTSARSSSERGFVLGTCPILNPTVPVYQLKYFVCVGRKAGLILPRQHLWQRQVQGAVPRGVLF